MRLKCQIFSHLAAAADARNPIESAGDGAWAIQVEVGSNVIKR